MYFNKNTFIYVIQFYSSVKLKVFTENDENYLLALSERYLIH